MSGRLTASPERLRLGIDLDGVVADFNLGWMRRYNADHGMTLEPSLVTGWDGLHRHTGLDSMEAFWAWARGDGRSVFRDLPLMPGAAEALGRLATQHRVVILTARFDWAIPDTLAWLGEHGIVAREVHFTDDKAAIPCDVYLDDAPYQLEAFVRAGRGATVCRAVRPWNVPVAGAVDVPDWPAFERLVAEVDGVR